MGIELYDLQLYSLLIKEDYMKRMMLENVIHYRKNHSAILDNFDLIHKWQRVRHP